MDPETQQCVNACPEAYDSARVCRSCQQANAATPFWNPTTQQCVQTCPQDLVPSSGGTHCKTCEEASSSTPFFDPDSQKCVGSCEETWDERGVCGLCVYATAGKRPFWNAMTRECVAKCPDELVPAYGHKCKTCEDVSAGAKYLDGDACVRKCPELLGENNVCRSCLQANPERPAWNAATGTCVACDASSFYDGQKCVAACEETYDDNDVCRACAEVDVARPKWNQLARRCRSCDVAIDGGDFWDGERCTVRCPETSVDFVCATCAELDPNEPLWDGATCRRCTAADGGPYWNGKECVAKCGGLTPFLTVHNTCRGCDATLDGGAYWDGTKCVAQCPQTWDVDRACKTCAEAAAGSDDPDATVWNPRELRCVSRCGPYQDIKTQCDCWTGLTYANGACELPDGLKWADAAALSICNAHGWALSLEGDLCVESCGDHGISANGRCECESGAYLDITGERQRCVTAAECGGYLDTSGSQGKCVTKAQCIAADMYTYRETGSRTCITQQSCLNSKHGYLYPATGECSEVEPDENGGFDLEQKKNGIYDCGDQYLDLGSSKRKCVDTVRCVLVLGRILSGKTCVGREAWLLENPRNFVGLNLSAQTYAGDLPIDPRTACVDGAGKPVDGAMLTDGRTCSCPEDGVTLYTSLLDGRVCAALPEIPDRSQLGYEEVLEYGGRQVSVAVLVTGVNCMTLGRYISADNRTCNTGCARDDFLHETDLACTQTC